MNKANVFLLVVVSSLLTYISTASYPAATAGVAQEKWEYGVSDVTRSDGRVFKFSFSSTNLDENREVASYRNKVRVVYGSGVSADVSDEEFDDESDQFSVFTFKCMMAFNDLGTRGWHPFQIDVLGQSEYNQYQKGTFQIMNRRVFWRRRVQ